MRWFTKKKPEVVEVEPVVKRDDAVELYTHLYDQNLTDYLTDKITFEAFQTNLEEITKAVHRNVERRLIALEEARHEGTQGEERE